MGRESKNVSLIRPLKDGTRGDRVRFQGKIYEVLLKNRPNLVRPAQYGVFDPRYRDSFLFTLRDVETGKKRKLILHPKGGIEHIPVDGKSKALRRRRKGD